MGQVVRDLLNCVGTIGYISSGDSEQKAAGICGLALGGTLKHDLELKNDEGKALSYGILGNATGDRTTTVVDCKYVAGSCTTGIGCEGFEGCVNSIEENELSSLKTEWE